MAKVVSPKRRGWINFALLGLGTFFIAGAIAIVSYYASGKYSGPKGTFSGPKPGTTALGFSVVSTSGKKFSFPVSSNKDVVLFFTSFTSCTSCLKQANELVGIQAKYSTNTKVIGIGISPRDNQSSLALFVNKIHNLNYGFYLQGNHNIAALYNIKGNNTIVVINRSRKIIFSGENPSASTLKEAVGEAVLES